MNSITIITIVVVVLLTVVIFGLTWLAYSSCIKSYKLEVAQGKHDELIVNEYRIKKKSISNLIGLICSYLVLSVLLSLFITGVVYKASGENLALNNKTVLVIKSESMAEYYNDELSLQYKELGYNADYQFDIGDICVFEKLSGDTELDKGEVYGYKYKDIIVTHRLINIEDGVYEFRGDNNPISDPYYVKRENIIYHYIGKKIPGLGAFILYAQSYFGIWSLIGIIGIAVSSEIVYRKIDSINKDRNNIIPFYKPQIETKKKRGKKNEK